MDTSVIYVEILNERVKVFRYIYRIAGTEEISSF